MAKLIAIAVLAALVCGCGSKEKSQTSAAAAPTPEPTFWQGDEDVEEEYHQPPKPAEAGLGETIVLTGTNLGVRLKVTVTDVTTTDRYTAVHLLLEGSGTAIYNDAFRGAALTYDNGDPQPLAEGAKAGCSNGFEDVIRLETPRKRKGCLLFPRSGSRTI